MRIFQSSFLSLPLATVAGFFMFGLDVASAQDGQTCSVLAIAGAPVRVEAAGEWQGLEVAPLRRDARMIATGPGARAELGCTGDLILTIGAGTQLDVRGLIDPAPSEMDVLRLASGMVGIDTPRTLEVHTPLATVSGRSANWLVEYSELTGVGVFVRSGQVDVSGRGGGTVQLNRQQGVTIVPGASRVQVLRWSASRIAGAAATLGFRWE